MSQFDEIVEAERFQWRLGEVRSTIARLAEPMRSEFGTLADEVQQQYETWQGNNAKVRLLMDDLRLIAQSVAFELGNWHSDIAAQPAEDHPDGEPHRRLDSPATVKHRHHPMRPGVPER